MRGDYSLLEVVFRLALAMLAAAIIGYGRAKKEQAAGLRTHMLISLGAAMSVLIPIYEYHMLTAGPWGQAAQEIGMKFDASRIVAQAIAGIGFLGVGIIIKGTHREVKGLTTATGLFAIVCISIAAGVGFYRLVILSYALIALVLNFMSPVEAAFRRHLRNITLHVEFNDMEDIGEITKTMREQHAEIYNIDIEETKAREGTYPTAIFFLKLSQESHSHSSMLSSLAELDCVHAVYELIM